MLSIDRRNTIFFLLSLLFLSEVFLTLNSLIVYVVLFRIIYFLVCFVLYLIYAKSKYWEWEKDTWIDRAILFYMFLFFIRILYDVFIMNKQTVYMGNNYTIVYFFVCNLILPFSMAKTINFNDISFNKLNILLCVAFLITALFSLENNIHSFSTGLIGLSRVKASGSLDSIGFGHLGLSLSILSICLLRSQRNNICKVLFFLVSIFGLFILFYGGSRGPVVAFITLLLIYIIVRKKYFAFVFLLIFIFLFCANYGEIKTLFESIGSLGLGRVFDPIMGYSPFSVDVTSGRSSIYELGLDSFFSNPLTGSGFVLNDGRYVHNSVLESFMATGIVGGILFLCVVCYVIFNILKCLSVPSRGVRPYDFVYYLFIQYTVYSLFSRELLTLSLFWLTLFLSAKLLLHENNAMNSYDCLFDGD